jgi:hypothetical protein
MNRGGVNASAFWFKNLKEEDQGGFFSLGFSFSSYPLFSFS